jgi:hypothetical protein
MTTYLLTVRLKMSGYKHNNIASLQIQSNMSYVTFHLHKEIEAPEKSPEADFSRQSRKKIVNCNIGDRQRDPCYTCLSFPF